MTLFSAPRETGAPVKASDIPDEAFLAAIDEACRIRSELDDGREWTWATRWDVAAVLTGHPEDVYSRPVDYPELPEKVLLAKARKLIRRGLVHGCECGCRGDWARKVD